jgi:hypothetical protein
MGPCIVIIFYYINPNKMHMLQSLFYLITALHVSGVTITHLQEHETTVTTASGNRYTVLLSAAIVEELVLIWVSCGWRTPFLWIIKKWRREFWNMLIHSIFLIQNMFLSTVDFRTEANLCLCNVQYLLMCPHW